MDGSIRLTAQERKRLLQAYRSGADARIARRAHVVLLRAEGRTWQEIKQVLFCSCDLIAGSLKAFEDGGMTAIVEPQAIQRSVPAWLLLILHWLTNCTPRDFGYFRTRWSCETLAHLLAWDRGLRLSGETDAEGCTGWDSSGVVPDLSWGRLIRNILRKCGEFADCWPIFRRMSWPSSRMKWICI